MIVNKRMACLALAAILVVMFGQGCTAILTSDQSVMQLTTSRNLPKLPLDSVTIQIVPQNAKVYGVVGPLVPLFPFWYSEAKNRFWFLISLLPQNGEITFDPSLVDLETERGDTFHAAGFNGPLRLADIIQNNSDPRKKLLDEKSLNILVSPFSISAEVLVGVMFETETIDPDQHFTLILKGLEREGHPIEVPPLKFNNERRRHFAFLLFDPLNIRKEWVVQ